MMVATVSGGAQKLKSNSSSQDHELSSRRMPLLQSLKDNSNSNSSSNFVNSNRLSNPRRSISKDVSSRYLSSSITGYSSNSCSGSNLSSSLRRFPSPIFSRNSTPVSNGASMDSKRSVSADRRRPMVSRDLTTELYVKQSGPSELSAAAQMLVTSTRNVSVSFQGEYFPLPISKAKVVSPSPNQNSVRKGMPERSSSSTSRGKVYGRGDQAENSKPSDQHRWPARAKQKDLLSRSLHCSGGEKSLVIGSGNMIRALQQSSMDERRSTFDGRLSLDLGSTEPLVPNEQNTNENLVNNESSVASDLTTSDTDSISSSSSLGVQRSGGSARIHSGPRGIGSSARFWQETNSRLRRWQDSGSHALASPTSKISTPSKLRKYPNDNVLALPRTMSSSPIRGGVRPASQRPASASKLVTPRASSPSRGFCSTSRVRNAVSTINNNFIDSSSAMSYSIDVRRGKGGENKMFDAHLLRLMYNRHLQWRFINARTEDSLLVQKHIVEKNLWGAWIMISKLRDTVTKKRHRLQLLRRKLKLAFILRGHMKCMEEWASLDKGHCISLLGAIEALKASTLHLPVVGGAVADIQSLKDAVFSTVDVMQAMLFSIHLFLRKVEEVNSLAIQLGKVTAKEQASLEQCKGFLSNYMTLKVKDCSLRTHMLQQKFRQKPTF